MSAQESKQFIQNRHGQRGQMAIFIALIFQILFVFFAMAINIGLVVYDKINLQNATDLAAFYAAQRQAEMLNVIAHTNYQVRQSWKLLNWRYYVLGTMGMEAQPGNPNLAHPINGAPRSEDTLWAAANTPVICVAYGPQWQTSSSDNSCKSENFKIENIRIPDVVAGFLPTNILFAGLAKVMQGKVAESCNGYSGYNWFFAANAYASYIKDQQSRKELIRSLAQNLARKPEEMVDLNGDLIIEGARKTFLKNLTAPNAEGAPEFEMYNSLEGLAPSKWLPEIDVWFTMHYQDLHGTTNKCETYVKQIDEVPHDSESWKRLVALTGNEAGLQSILAYAKQAAKIEAGNSRRISLGVEKNPWYLAYMGVRGKSKPRQLFFPFGEGVKFEARAYAQPFGGRIGPWYGRHWARGAEESSGDLVQLSPEKLRAGGMMNTMNPAEMRKRIPQYAKYPGDLMGLRSLLAQQSLKGQMAIRAKLSDYRAISDEFGMGKQNDVLAFDENPASNIRQYEIAAIAPDLFDITYYSIQSNYGERYLEPLRLARDRLGISDLGYPRGDLGSRESINKSFSVRDQMNVAHGLGASGLSQALGGGATGTNLHELDAFWFVREPSHLLTSWVHNDTYGEYEAFPVDRFGNCSESDEKYKTKAPGGCLVEGGRSGYSVKIISPDMFEASLPLGGPGQGPGKIMNPPSWKGD